MEDKRFMTFLNILVNVGNTLNAGTMRGNAPGITIESLKVRSKLIIQSFSSCKSHDGKTYLMNYILEKLYKSYPEFLEFLPEICGYLNEAADFEIDGKHKIL